MGNWFCRTKKLKILMMGLDHAGKTTMLYNMKLGEVISAIPTIAFNAETVQIEGAALTCWDVSSRGPSRVLWRQYYPSTQGFVFVIDSADKFRLDEAINGLERDILTSEETKNTVIMIMANKQDKEGAMTAQEIEHLLMEKCRYLKHCMQPVFVMPCSAYNRNQIMEAFSYFAELMILNCAGKAKRGLITLEERQAELAERSKAESGLALKFLLRGPVQYFKAFFE
jgi:small GTP-binding protein